MNKYNITGGSIGAVGDGAQATNFTQHDRRTIEISSEDLPVLLQELPQLRTALEERAMTAEHQEAVRHVSAAEEAARAGNSKAALERLKQAGQFALEVGKSIGTSVASRYIAQQLGIGS